MGAGNSNFGFSSSGSGSAPVTNTNWLLDGNSELSEKYFGTNNDFSIPIYTNGVVRGVFDNTGNFGFGISTALTSRVHIQGLNDLASEYSLKIDNSSSVALLYVRNDGYTTINGLNVGKGINQVSSNTAFGVSALSIATGIENTAIGYQALRDTTTGVTNTAIGNNALLLNTIGIQNTAIGYNSGRGGIISNNNTSIGFYTLFNNTGDNNTAIGDRASYGNTTGAQNVAIGRFSLYTNLIGQHNVAIGHNALNLNTSSGSVAIGSGASAQATGANLVSVGRDSFAELTTGAQNTVLGWNSGRGITTGSNNTVIGSNITGLTTTLSNSILIGDSSGLVTFYTNSSGDTMLGAGFVSASARLHVQGIDATALNYVLKLDDIASSPLLYVQNNGYVGIGIATPNNKLQVAGLIDFNPTTFLTAIGGSALISNTVGQRGVGIGYLALTANTSGDYNTAVGAYSGYSITIGMNNTSVGMGSLLSTLNGSDNTALGEAAMTRNIAGNNNSSIGSQSLFYSTGDDNNALGFGAGGNLATGNANIFIGKYAGNYITDGSSNVVIGFNGAIPAVTSNSIIISTSGGNVYSYTDASNNTIIDNGLNTPNAKFHIYGINATTKINQRLEPVANVTQDITGDTIGTTDATANVTAQTITMPTNGNVSIESTIVYRKTAGAGVGTVGDGTTIILNTSVRSVAGVLTLDTIQNTYTGIVNAIAGCSATFTISGSNILVSVTGVLNDNITWNVISKLNTLV